MDACDWLGPSKHDLEAQRVFRGKLRDHLHHLLSTASSTTTSYTQPFCAGPPVAPLWSFSVDIMSTRLHPTARSEKRASTSAQSSSRPRHPSSGTMPGENERRSTPSGASAQSHPRNKSTLGERERERRTEKREVLTRETVSVRTRSPLKHTSESRVNARSRTEKPARTTERTSERSAATTRPSSTEAPGKLAFVSLYYNGS